MANFVVDDNKNLGHVPPSMLYVCDFSEREELKGNERSWRDFLKTVWNHPVLWRLFKMS